MQHVILNVHPIRIGPATLLFFFLVCLFSLFSIHYYSIFSPIQLHHAACLFLYQIVTDQERKDRGHVVSSYFCTAHVWQLSCLLDIPIYVQGVSEAWSVLLLLCIPILLLLFYRSMSYQHLSIHAVIVPFQILLSAFPGIAGTG